MSNVEEQLNEIKERITELEQIDYLKAIQQIRKQIETLQAHVDQIGRHLGFYDSWHPEDEP